MNEIKVRTYKINENENIVFNAYSADWCGPCQRIKPYYYNYLKDYDYTETVIEKSEFKKLNDKIPFFQIKMGELIINSIQTSNHLELCKFLIDNNITINKELDPNIDF